MLAALVPRLSRWNVAIGLYAVVSLCALAGLLLSPGTVGHHWDWLVPSDPAELRRAASIETTSWQDFSFGSYVTYRYATVLTGILFGLPGFLGLGGDFVSKALIGSGLFIAAIAMRFLLLSLTRDDPDERDGAVATICGLLYGLAPYTYNQIVSGDQSALLSDALAPLAIALAVRAVKTRDRAFLAYAIGAGLVLAAMVASVQVFVFTIALGAVVCLAVRPALRTAGVYALVVACGAALCSFWFLPVALAGSGVVHTVVQTTPIEDAFATLVQFSNPLMTATMLAFPGYFYSAALGWGAIFYYIAYGALVVLCAVAMMRRRTLLLTVLAIVFVVTAIAPLGGNPVVGPLILWLFRLLLPYSLFLRTPQHLMFIISMVVPMLAYLSYRVIPPRYAGAMLVAGVAIFAAYSQGFFTHGRFFGLLGPFREMPGERATIAMAQEPANKNFRTLFVPNAPGYYYHPAIFDYYFEGGDEPQIRFLPTMSMGAGVKWSPYDRTQSVLKALDELVPDGADPQTQAFLLQLTGVRNLVVHGFGVPSAGIRDLTDNDRLYLEHALQTANIAHKIGDYGDRSIWRFDRAVPRLYTPDCLFKVPPQADLYAVLALAPAASHCERPATIAANEDFSEYVMTPAEFTVVPQHAVDMTLDRSNVFTSLSASGKGFDSVIGAGVQDVQIYDVPPVPSSAKGISLRMYATALRKVYVQLLAPDVHHMFEATVVLKGRVADVALTWSQFGRIGNPQLSNVQSLRLASENQYTRDVQMYVGGLEWLKRPRPSRNVSYLTVAGNRWDRFYFGGDRYRPLYAPQLGNPPVYASFDVRDGGTFDLVAHVQDVDRELSIQATVDGRAYGCTSSLSQTDQTERLVSLARATLGPGRHDVTLRYCGGLPAHAKGSGIQTLILAAARLQPPAQESLGSMQLLDAKPGEMHVRAYDFHLIFTDSYDDRWVAFQDGRPLRHVIANGYANGYLIPDPSKGDVTLVFLPQRPLEIGIWVTAVLVVAAIVLMAGIAWSVRRERAAAQ